MLQRDRHIRTQVHQLGDAGLFALSFWLAFALRGHPAFVGWVTTHLGSWFPFFRLDPIAPDAFDHIVWLYFALVPAAPLVLESQGFYSRPLVGSRLGMLWPLLKSSVIVTVGLVLLVFIYREAPNVPRGVMIIFGCISFGTVWIKEEVLRLMLRSRLAREQYKRRVILAGTPGEIARLRQMLQTHAADTMAVAAEFDLTQAPVSQLVELLHEHSISGVFVSAKHTQLDRVESVIQLCELEGVEAWLVADFFATQIAHASFDEMFGHPLLVFRSTPEASWQMLAKLLLDFMGALLMLLVAAIPMLVIAWLIKLTSPGPAIFRQQRSGLNGAPFTIYKFRTMATNAEQFKHELAAMNEMSGPVFKVTNDPRVTAFGKFLRFDGKNDDGLVEALKYGMPPTGGMGIGIDRLAMTLAGVQNIQDVILFPTKRNKTV